MLNQAKENPWYLLATLHGEQPEGASFLDFNRVLHAKNRLAWNRFIRNEMNEEELEWARSLKDEDGTLRFSQEELAPYKDAERAELQALFNERGGERLPDGAIDFIGITFERIFIAKGFLFSKDTKFYSATYSKGATFDSAVFLENSAFHNVCFSSFTSFKNAAFIGDAVFFNTTFEEHADFKQAEFSIDASFESAQFKKYADFKSVNFSRAAGFKKVIFSGVADFKRAKFSGGADFKSTTFSENTDFRSATFSENANFYFAHFKSTTRFDGAIFTKHPPDFNGAPTLFEGTIWPGPEGWPAAPDDAEAARDHQSCYERLKKDAETHKKHRQELFFFSKELECQEVIDGPWKGWPIKIYGVTALYGASLLRPLLCLGFTFAMGFIYFVFAAPLPLGANAPAVTQPSIIVSTPKPCLERYQFCIKTAAGLSFANTLWPLGLRKDLFETEIKAMSPLGHILSVAQGGFGLLFTFLIGLALRNRFRMK